jgi:hypothetical protein
MAHEKGGRADKLGNRYEDRWVAEQLLDLCCERIISLTHEPVGDTADDADLQILKIDGIIELQQCKSSNGNKSDWSISDLARQCVFLRARKHLDSDGKYKYKFISPLNCQAMTTLIERAKNSPENANDFYDYQIKAIPGINHAVIEKNFNDFLKHMDLSTEDEQSILYARDYLSRMEFVTVSDDYLRKSIINRLSDVFSAKPLDVYNHLVNFAIENDRLGQKITVTKINDYLTKNEIYKTDLSNHDLMLPRINELNKEFEQSFVPIESGYIHRTGSDIIFSTVTEGKSVLLHGKAGTGKSGCVQALTKKLRETGIPYLALKLDKWTPENTCHKYGVDMLGLPGSPALCLSRLAANGVGVLILDQLDAIRWTAQHTRTALEVCKELINQVNRINSDSYIIGKVAIVFICRTVDVDTDSGIKSLFRVEESKEDKILWEKIEIGDLEVETVKRIVGKPYSSFSDRFIELLKNINNLYVWSKLDDERKSIQHASMYSLIISYWNQFEQRCREVEIDLSEVNNLKSSLVKGMERTSRNTIPTSMLHGCSLQARNKAISEGILIETRSTVSFVHQSFYDVFIVEAMVEGIFTGSHIETLIGLPENQTPQVRYQLQMLLQILSELDQELLVKCGNDLLHSRNIRFYLKYVLWEVVGQVTNAETILLDFVEQSMQNADWYTPIVNTVISGHPYYVNHFIENGCISQWLNTEKRDTVLNLLRSVNTIMGDQVTEILMPLAFKCKNQDIRIFRTLCWEIEDDTDSMFALRLQLLEANPELFDDYSVGIRKLAKKDLLRAGRLLEHILVNKPNAADSDAGRYFDSDFNIFEHLGSEQPEYVWEELMPIIENITSNATNVWAPVLRGWHDMGNHPVLGRKIANMVITAGKRIAETQPEKYMNFFNLYKDSSSFVINEILLYSCVSLPVENSDFIINWLVSSSYSRPYDETGEYKTKLCAAKKLIEKFSKTCSDGVFIKLEEIISGYHDEYELERAKRRFEHNRMVRNRDIKDSNEVYWPYWGELQAYLL